MRASFGRRATHVFAGLALAGVAMTSSAAVWPVTAALARTAQDKPSEQIEISQSLIGSYLAGRFARVQNDTDAAARYYEAALLRDPGNEVLLEQAFLMESTEANWPRAIVLADELARSSPTHRMARLFLGLAAFKNGQLDKAEEHLVASGNGPIGELTSALARAWTKLAGNNADEAIALLEIPKQAEWAQYYLRYHRALIADLSSRRADARTSYERVFKQDPRTLRTALAFTQHAANAGDVKMAKSIIKEHLDKSQGDGHPLARELRDKVNGNAKIPLLIESPTEGLAEVFYGLGEALTGEGGVSIGILYLQMALFLQPDQPFALAALANAHETTRKFEDANAVYNRISPGSALQPAIDIRKAFNLNALDRVDEAKAMLEQVAAADPSDLKPLDALGNIMRSKKRYLEATDYYSRAIALIDKPEKRHWSYFYARGTSYERLKKWPLAEADLLKALQLYPDQPLVLNYLGYSWIDQGRNLKQGLSLIEKAVSLKPEDGYIVDSLGWAHFKLENYKDAVRYLERAVELRPEDPVLNDHLGDALWRVGREREARFQWEQSLSLEPEADDAERTAKKLIKGLPAKPIARAPKKVKEAGRPTPQRKRETKLAPDAPFFQ